jgi:hypothetical protein
MKIIFLDIDGVLNSQNFFKTHKPNNDWKETDDIDRRAIAILNNILEKTNAKIVISSSWRIGRTLENLKLMAKIVGIHPEKIFSKTPVLNDKDRGFEIEAWLEQNKTEKFVILDDDSDMGNLMHHLVKTKSETGLTKELAEKVINLLS